MSIRYNMRLFSEVIRRLTDGADITSALIYYIVDGRSAYFQNVKSILSFSGEEIELSARSGSIVIRGENLIIRSVEEGDVIIEGEVREIERRS